MDFHAFDNQSEIAIQINGRSFSLISYNCSPFYIMADRYFQMNFICTLHLSQLNLHTIWTDKHTQNHFSYSYFIKPFEVKYCVRFLFPKKNNNKNIRMLSGYHRSCVLDLCTFQIDSLSFFTAHLLAFYFYFYTSHNAKKKKRRKKDRFTNDTSECQ